MKDPLGIVHLQGNAVGGASGTVAFVLPARFRPGITDFYPLLQGGGVAGSFVNIATNGAVTVTAAGSVFFNGLTFLAEN
jgi:hypothetical protein